MASVNLKVLLGFLNDQTRRALEAAAGICVSRSHYNLEIEHWLIKLVETTGLEMDSVFRHYGIESSHVLRDLTKSIDRFKTGNARPPAMSTHVVDWAREAWLLASLELGATRITSGHLLTALLTSETLGGMARESCPALQKIDADDLKRSLGSIVANSPETASTAAAAASASQGSGAPAIRPGGKSPNLDQFTIDLTARAKDGKIDPVLGRDPEVRQIIDILMRRRQNNPILTGEAGVGKTAVVEGFANRIASGDVPEPMKNVRLLSLDLGLLQAGAGVKGEFENRLKGVIDEVKASTQPIILFIDEAHTLIGAGGAAGQNDAANLLKPALARGEMRTIAATTWAEYKKYFEKDPALARRFQNVKVEEPDEPTAIEMMRGLVATMEKHHKVRVLDEAVAESVRLSHRYISGRQLPDKAVGVLDTACARVAIGQAATPAPIEDAKRRIEQLGVAADILRREEAGGANHVTRIGEIEEEKGKVQKQLESLEARYKRELELVELIRKTRDQLESGSKKSDASVDREALRKNLEETTATLRGVQGDSPLVNVCVDGQAVADVVGAWTGIPVGRMLGDEIKTVLNMKDKLEERIVGQSHALDAIAKAIRTSRAKMVDPRKPIGVFLMVGTSGVGKTETAIALTELLYGGEQNMTVINMSEFKEEHKVSLLMGSPPGYVGYGEGGVLTEAVRRKPYSVVLLDEMEKAHPGIQDVFYQVFDKGQMKDGEGRDINFKNTLVIMTSNAATDLITSLCADPETAPTPEALAEAIYPELLKTFKPAFLGRCTIVPYFPLPPEILKRIIELKLKSIARRFKENYRATMSWTPAVVETIVSRCTEVSTGARNIDNILSKTVLPELSAELLARMADGQVVSTARVDVGPDSKFVYQVG
jgi:type VI secretion system protein VasG